MVEGNNEKQESPKVIAQYGESNKYATNVSLSTVTFINRIRKTQIIHWMVFVLLK